MDIEKYSERVRGFIQSAQTMALSRNHQQFTPEHLLKVLVDDQEGLAASLISRAGGDVERRPAWASRRRSTRCRSVEGGNGQLYMAQPLAKVFSTAEDMAKKAGDSFVTVERLLTALAVEKSAKTADILAKAGVTPQALNQAINDLRKGRTANSASAEQGYDALEEICARPDRRCPRGQARSGDRPRRRDPPHHPGAVAPHQEQSRADRRARRRQDGDRRRPGAAHRQWRRAGIAEGQAVDGARHGRADRRREISRRVRGAAEGGARRKSPRPPAASSCSSTRCTRWSAPARRTARWMRRTC